MKKIYLKKILKLVLILFFVGIRYSNNVQATEAIVYSENCNVGEDVNITIDFGDAYAFEYDVSITFSDGTTNTKHGAGTANYSDGKTKTFKAICSGNASININNILLYDNSNPPQIINTVKSLHTAITITDPTPVQPEPIEKPVEDNSNNSVESEEKPAELSSPKAPVILEFNNTNEKMYTTRRVNVRQNYGTDGGIIQTLAVGTEVIRTGVSDGVKDGYYWSRVSYDGITGYIITGALTDEEPIAQEIEDNTEQPATNSEEIEENNQENTNTVDSDKIKEISEKLGTIPQVGLNIIPFMFFGSCVTCLILIVDIKRRINE